MSAERWTTLPCGHDPAPLITYVADHTAPPAGSHAATCPYCQAAISELGELWEPVTAWAQRDIRLPERFLATVVARIRRVVQSPHHVASTGTKGTTTVTSWVLGLIASAAIRDTPGVTAITGAGTSTRRRNAIRYGADGVDIAEVGAADIAATLGITARARPDLPLLADTVRHNVIDAIANHTTIRTAEVDITIDNLDF